MLSSQASCGRRPLVVLVDEVPASRCEMFRSPCPAYAPALEHVGVFKVRVLAGLTAFPCEGCDSRREGLWRPRGAHRVSLWHCGQSPFRQHGVRTCLARPANFHSLRLQKLRLHTDFLNPVSE